MAAEAETQAPATPEVAEGAVVTAAEDLAPGLPTDPSKIRIGNVKHGFIYTQKNSNLWKCARCSDMQDVLDGQKEWRLYIILEASRIAAYDALPATEGEGPDFATMSLRFWTRDLLALEDGWHKWYIGSGEENRGDFETAVIT